MTIRGALPTLALILQLSSVAGAAGQQAFSAAELDVVRAAAEQGDAEAQSILGVMYGHGMGVPQDFAEAMRWYRKAAEQGHALGQSALGIMYVEGRGVPQDLVLAHKWLNLAAARMPASIENGRKMAVDVRDLVAKFLTAAQLAEAQRLALEWRPTESEGPWSRRVYAGRGPGGQYGTWTTRARAFMARAPVRCSTRLRCAPAARRAGASPRGTRPDRLRLTLAMPGGRR